MAAFGGLPTGFVVWTTGFATVTAGDTLATGVAFDEASSGGTAEAAGTAASAGAAGTGFGATLDVAEGVGKSYFWIWQKTGALARKQADKINGVSLQKLKLCE